MAKTTSVQSEVLALKVGETLSYPYEQLPDSTARAYVTRCRKISGNVYSSHLDRKTMVTSITRIW